MNYYIYFSTENDPGNLIGPFSTYELAKQFAIEINDKLTKVDDEIDHTILALSYPSPTLISPSDYQKQIDNYLAAL
jgi:hypothetical protein